jgi:ElaB/YqjD/DUF883 family membrane-anchored ribosome-binding protein
MSDNIQKAKSNLEAAGNNAKNEAKDRLDDINDSAQEAKGKAKAQLNNVNERIQQSCEKVKSYVKSNPLTALGIAAAVGMGVATLINRK